MSFEDKHIFDNLKKLTVKVEFLKEASSLDASMEELANLKKKSEMIDFWQDQDNARKTLKRISLLEKNINTIKQLESDISDMEELAGLAEQTNDSQSYDEISLEVEKLLKLSEMIEIRILFDGEYDSGDCFFEIHSGAGGTESNDWSEMLLRMYLRFMEKNDFKAEVLATIPGEEAGIKSVALRVSGEYAYGLLKTEMGVHRLVRISPYNAAAKRHTSFSAISVYPELDTGINIEISPGDLRIDTYRASGTGGQHVNTTDSAVRITHIPTGIVVQSQSSRSQHQNKATCMKMLESRLYQHELQKKQQKNADQNSIKSEIGWGNQIRSYVLHPYQMVKDLRSNHSNSDTESVLDGNILEFIYSALRHSKTGNKISKR